MYLKQRKSKRAVHISFISFDGVFGKHLLIRFQQKLQVKVQRKRKKKSVKAIRFIPEGGCRYDEMPL